MKLILLLFLMYPNFLICQVINSEKMNSNKLPAGVKFRGQLNEAWKWRDKKGENILITSVVGPYNDTIDNLNDDGQTKELFVYHYVRSGAQWKPLWRMQDAVRACNVDMTAMFIKKAITITDLDRDSIAETKVQYALGCAGDISPPDMKLIIHEDTVKYALRGQMWNKASFAPGTVQFKLNELDLSERKDYKNEAEDYIIAIGRYKNENDFKNAPPTFIVFARKEWLKFSEHKFPE